MITEIIKKFNTNFFNIDDLLYLTGLKQKCTPYLILPLLYSMNQREINMFFYPISKSIKVKSGDFHGDNHGPNQLIHWCNILVHHPTNIKQHFKIQLVKKINYFEYLLTFIDNF